MSYIQPHMLPALAGHVLDEITEPGSPVRSFSLHNPAQGKKGASLITFTPEGVVIQGDLRPGENGAVSEPGLTFEWFLSEDDEERLCSKFLTKVWQTDAAERDLRHLAQTVDPLEAIRLNPLREAVGAGHGTDQGVREVLQRLGYGKEQVWNIGYDYPLADAGWLCAIQRRFKELHQQVS